jgi:hypothetical protein
MASFRKAAEKVGTREQRALYARLRDGKFVADCLFIAYDAPTQHQRCLIASRHLGVNPETVRRWIEGATSPSMKDFWPVIMRVVESRAPADLYPDLVQLLLEV